jgi:uncharacterized protein YndB with AHSA1/START domain
MIIVLYVLVVLLILLLLILVYAATRPDEFSVRRSIAIAAPPERVFPLINDFHKWQGWSPWEQMDPGMARTLSGSESGKGAVYEWSGNNKVGAGRMAVLEAAPPSFVLIALSFLKPFKAENQTTFTLTAADGGTDVSWEMSGSKNLIMKAMGLFINMDRMIGNDFEKGLASMKMIAEAAAN